MLHIAILLQISYMDLPLRCIVGTTSTALHYPSAEDVLELPAIRSYELSALRLERYAFEKSPIRFSEPMLSPVSCLKISA